MYICSVKQHKQTTTDMYELLLKSLKITEEVSTIKFETEHPEEKIRVIALALLTGAYIPMRRHSDSGVPLDIERLRDYELELECLLKKVAKEMDVNANDIQEL